MGSGSEQATYWRNGEVFCYFVRKGYPFFQQDQRSFCYAVQVPLK